MLSISTLFLFIISLLNLLLGALIYLRNRQSRLNILFLLFSASIASWSITNIIFQEVEQETAYTAALVSYAAAGLIALFFLLFTQKLLNMHVSKLQHIVIVGLGFAITSFSAIPGTISTGVDEEYQILTTNLISVYSLYLVSYFGYSIILLLRALRRADGLLKQQISYILVGFVLAAIMGLFFNLLLPITGNYNFVQIGPVSSIVLVASIGYSIVKHGLFDIRIFIARSVGYVLSVGSLGLIYGLLAYGILQLVYPDLNFTIVQISILVAMALFFSAFFQPIKRFFDSISDSIFYSDSYDSQNLINNISQLGAQALDTASLSRGALDFIKATLRPTDGAIILLKDGDAYRETTISGNFSLNSKLLHSLTAEKSEMLAIDVLDYNNPTAQSLRENGISLVVKLIAADTLQGLLVLGSRKSGNSYTRNDTNVLRTLAYELAISIQNAHQFEEIQEFNLTLQKKIDDATAELRRTNAKLKALDEAKDEFISMASHQLRTPLTSIKGYLSMVLEGDAGKVSSKQEEMLDSAFTSSQRMVYLIADLLNVSRLKTGKFVIERKPVDLVSIVAGEVEQLQATAKTRRLKLKFHKPKSFPEVKLDETKIRQVVMNFVDNAIYYTPSGGKIDVYLEADKNSISYKVVDNGIGVPKSEQHKLFTKFYRAANARKARPDGTGLGLFMAQKVVVAQDGAVIFESEPGKGSTFGFSFPLSKVAIHAEKKSKNPKTKKKKGSTNKNKNTSKK